MNKKPILIISCCLAGVIAALGAVFLIVNHIKNNIDEAPPSYLSSSISETDETEVIEENIPIVNEIGLEISSPVLMTSTTTESIYNFIGTSDPLAPLTLNGNEVERLEDGSFSVPVDLVVGKNTFVFLHKDKTYTYNVTRRYIVINSISPEGNQIYSSGSTFSVVVNARPDSCVTAQFNGETITLSLKPTAEAAGEFCDYIGNFKLPSDNYADLSLGKVKFTATQNGVTEAKTSGNITCKRPDFIVEYDPDATPLGDRYVNVGSGKITEIISSEAETFNAKSTDDASRPTNSYLPKGTVDYSAQGYYYYKDQKEFVLLRCGKQVYTNKKDVPTNELQPVVKHYSGTLPDHNEIGIASFENGSQHTMLTLDCMWKAPFYFDILPQSYNNPNKQDYNISSFTANYIDITFCYATVLTGELNIPEDNPLFSSAKIIQNSYDYTLRLYLKKQGGFYGWDANYNDNGQLVFEFLNPARVTSADNKYGADLTGTEILIDVGHGGIDPGAIGFNNLTYSEANLNLSLAKSLKTELESIGATVYLTRESDVTSSNNDKIITCKNLKPDYVLAIHHNSFYTSKPNGYGAYYYNAFSQKAADLIWMNTMNTNIYKPGIKTSAVWHYYYLARCSYCPVVLTENGFISNSYDFSNMIDEGVAAKKVEAMAKGICQYFLGLN